MISTYLHFKMIIFLLAYSPYLSGILVVRTQDLIDGGDGLVFLLRRDGNYPLTELIVQEDDIFSKVGPGLKQFSQAACTQPQTEPAPVTCRLSNI